MRGWCGWAAVRCGHMWLCTAERKGVSGECGWRSLKEASQRGRKVYTGSQTLLWLFLQTPSPIHFAWHYSILGSFKHFWLWLTVRNKFKGSQLMYWERGFSLIPMCLSLSFFLPSHLSKQGGSYLWPVGCMQPRMAMNVAQHKITNLLKTL